MIWACSAATGSGHLAVIESTIELLWIPKYSRVRCEAVCPPAKAGLKLGRRIGQTHLLMAEKEKV